MRNTNFWQVIGKNLWTYVILSLLVFYTLLYLTLDLPANMDSFASVNPLRTLLGGLATGLITAQALVFTISLVAAQLNARYTHRIVARMFAWPTGLFMGLFIGSSIYSMVVLAALSAQPSYFMITLPIIRLNLHPVTLALAMAGTCLGLLVPYLWSFKRKLDPECMAIDEGNRSIAYLRKHQGLEPPGIAALDNIIMSAYTYKDYDTFIRGLDELSKVGLEAWLVEQSNLGESIFRRLTQIGISSIDDPRAPFEVIRFIESVGAILTENSLPEGSRRAAVAISGIGEIAVEELHIAVLSRAADALTILGEKSVDNGLPSTAEETVYSLGSLGLMASRKSLENSIRQIAILLRRVGIRASGATLDLVTRQAVISLWGLGGSTHRNLHSCTEMVIRELELMEQVTDRAFIEASYLATPQGEDLRNFRQHYIKEIHR